MRTALAGTVAAALLSGCLGLNDVSRVVEPGYTPSANRALLVIGAGMEGNWKAQKFPISLYEYDIQRKSITGNCWRSNEVHAATELEIEYFVFDVAPGFYAGGGGMAVFRDQTSPLAFEVPAGRVVYVGDFVYAKDRKVDLRRNMDRAMAAVKSVYPNITGEPLVAEAVPVPTLQMFLCAP